MMPRHCYSDQEKELKIQKQTTFSGVYVGALQKKKKKNLSSTKGILPLLSVGGREGL